MLTKVDHWLRETFLLRTEIYTMRLPEGLPSGVKTQELPESASRQHKFRLLCPSSKVADGLAVRFREEGLMFATQVVEKNPWFKPLIAPQNGSVVFNVFWLFSFAAMIFGMLRLGDHLRQNEKFMGELRDAASLLSTWGK